MHLNSQKRINLDNAVYFVTTKTRDNYPYFSDEVLAELCLAKIYLAQAWLKFDLYGFVILPDHLHLMIMPIINQNISQIMHHIKRNTSRSANILINQNMFNNKKHVGEDDHPRPRVYKQFKWFSSFHDHIIRDDRDFNNHLAYIKFNPIKHGLLADPQTNYPYLHINHTAIQKLFTGE
jgi:putative transposase